MLRNDNSDNLMSTKEARLALSPHLFTPNHIQEGSTALMQASRMGNLEGVKALVAAKADVNAKNKVPTWLWATMGFT